MKKFLILSLTLLATGSAMAQLHTVRRTLMEEFTSSSSDSCAASDPVVELFEGEAPGKFCIVKWYIPWGLTGGSNAYYSDYPLSTVRSTDYYNNNEVPTIFLNGSKPFSPYHLSLDSLRAKVSPEYSRTSPFILNITQHITGDSLIADIFVRQLDTTIDISKMSIGVIVTERYNQYSDINRYPYHTNIVRTVLPSLEPKTGEIRDALPFAYVMQGQTEQSFRFATRIGVNWNQYELACVGVIQDNGTKEVVQCNWTVPEIKFSRPSPSTYLVVGGQTACQFSLTNVTDSDFTVFPQLSHNAPPEWNLRLSGMDYPSFVLKAHSSALGTLVADQTIPIRGSGDFYLLFRTDPGITVANISGSLIGNDSRDLIIKNRTQSVFQSDPDIKAWKNFGLDAAFINDDAVNDIFGSSLLRFRTVYVTKSKYGSLADLASIKDYMAHGGRMIFQSTTALGYFSNSIIDTSVNKYAPIFEHIFRTLPGSPGFAWTKGNVAVGNVFADTLPAPFTVSSRPVQPLSPIDTSSKPMIVEQGGHNVGVAIESDNGKIAYLTFPLSDIQNQNTSQLLAGEILTWFQKPLSKVSSTSIGEIPSAVYPNPVNTIATLQYDFSQSQKVTVGLYDELGRKITPSIQIISEHQLNIDCSSLQAGTYYYSLIAGEKAARGKIVVSH